MLLHLLDSAARRVLPRVNLEPCVIHLDMHPLKRCCHVGDAAPAGCAQRGVEVEQLLAEPGPGLLRGAAKEPCSCRLLLPLIVAATAPHCGHRQPETSTKRVASHQARGHHLQDGLRLRLLLLLLLLLLVVLLGWRPVLLLVVVLVLLGWRPVLLLLLLPIVWRRPCPFTRQ